MVVRARHKAEPRDMETRRRLWDIGHQQMSIECIKRVEIPIDPLSEAQILPAGVAAYSYFLV